MTNFKESPESEQGKERILSQEEMLAKLAAEDGMSQEEMLAKLAAGGMTTGKEHVLVLGREADSGRSPESEQGKERIPSREEVLSLIHGRCGDAKVSKERSDRRGVYFLEAQGTDKKSGELTLYTYHRKGEFPRQNATPVTVLEAVYFGSDGVPCGGDTIAEIDPETNEWVEK